MKKTVSLDFVEKSLAKVPPVFSSINTELRRHLERPTTQFEGGALGFFDLTDALFKPSQRWLHVTYPGVSGGPYDHITVKFSSETEFQTLGRSREFIFDLPMEFTEFLDFFNGMRLFVGSIEFAGFDGEDRYKVATSSDYEPPPITYENTHWRPPLLAQKYVVIGRYMYTGFRICWDSDADLICAIHETTQTPVAQWKNFYTFLDQEIPRIAAMLPDDLRMLRTFPRITPGGL